MMKSLCTFLAEIHRVSESEILFDLFHDRLPSIHPMLLKRLLVLPRVYFDFLIEKGVLQVRGVDTYQPTYRNSVAVGMNMKSLGSTVLFDMCFSKETYQLWQKMDAVIEDISLPADLFEDYVYRLGALSRFRHLGRLDDPIIATKLGENDMIEFKQDFLNSKQAIIKAIVAFANSNNGNIFLGISDDSKIVGVNDELAHYGDPDKYLLAITQYIQIKTTPILHPFPKISLREVEGKFVVSIFVEVGNELMCGLDKNNEKYVSIRTNNRSFIVKDPHQIGEIYVKRKLGSDISRRLGLL
ncbi:ATP-binding protein [Brevibacillus laterosporus]|nr:ATP-binding protein [Brevibacillus laterosporus]MBM7107560.1 Divergent AAA domain protein [Brevibacillus laterosporus]MCZ0848751.1 ATP-binding protein [Brevibacillus laterosporus]WNX29937.1 ATP-binding protein [Brevibacillus laterosporus]